MATKTCKKKITKKQPSVGLAWHKTLAENYQLPTDQLALMIPFVKESTIRRYKSFLTHFAKGESYLTKRMPSGLKKAYSNLKGKRRTAPKNVNKTWTIEYSFEDPSGVFSIGKHYKSKKSVLIAVTKALKDKWFKDFKITYKEN